MVIRGEKPKMRIGVFVALQVTAWMAVAGPESRVRLAVNEDNDHYFHFDRSRMNRKALCDYVDSYAAGGKVSHIFWTTCGQPANYDSKAWEPVWKRLEDPAYQDWTKGREMLRRWPENCKLLHDQGIDPYVVWIDRCRERGISPWISMRMNDVHFATHRRMQVCRSVKFWREHPEFGRNPGWDRFDPDHREWKRFAFDYTHPEVRAYSLAMAKEQIERYLPDGLELDWMRYVCHLPPGRERGLAHVLTAFMRDVRGIADAAERRAGHRIRLGVRIPSRYAYARDLGYDAETWAKEGLCDLFVVCNKDSVDYGCDVADWKRRLAPAEVIPGMDRVDCTHTERVYADYAGYCGWADAARARGAEGLYLFNAIYLTPEVQNDLWSRGLEAEDVRRGPRRYVATYPDSAPDDIPEPSLCQLPRSLAQKIGLEIFAGHGCAEKTVEVVLAFDRPVDAASVRLTLNDVAAEGAPVEEHDFGKRYGDPKFAKAACRWRFPLAALKPDRNQLAVQPLPGSSAEVRWAEIAVDLERH